MLIEGATFDRCHREDKRLVAWMLTLRVEFSKIQSAQAGIEMEVELFDISCLAIFKPSELFGIPKDELSLFADLP